MTRATRAVVDLSALKHNFNIARQAAPHSRQLAVIKANGYGHGITQMARALEQADAFGVACLDEAISLREAGIPQPIVLLEGFSRSADINLVRGYGLHSVIHHVSQLELLEQAGGVAIPVWLKLDTGMHRLGFSVNEAEKAYLRLQQCNAVSSIGVMTHLANADDQADEYTRLQLGQFDSATQHLEAKKSIANSAGILGWPASHRDWVRPGIMLYGVSPFLNDTAATQQLRPVMTLHSELIAVNWHQQGEPVGYGGGWVCPQEMPVGVVAIGYGDGYPRHAKTGTPVLVNGKRATLIGRVSMDMICVDLRTQPEAGVGDPVVLWGEGLPIEEIAASADTIAYELLCKVTSRVSFDYR